MTHAEHDGTFKNAIQCSPDENTRLRRLKFDSASPPPAGLIKQFLCDVDWGDLDFLLVDTPPGTSDEHISVAEYMKPCGIDGAIIVTTPQEVALLDVRKEINFCKKVDIPIIGVVENMSWYAIYR